MFCDHCANYIFGKKYPNNFSKEIKLKYNLEDIDYFCEGCYYKLKEAEGALLKAAILQKSKEAIRNLK